MGICQSTPESVAAPEKAEPPIVAVAEVPAAPAVAAPAEAAAPGWHLYVEYVLSNPRKSC